MNVKTLISAEDATRKIAQLTGGKAWCKGGANRVYTKCGYLAIAPETATSAQVCYHTKSYEIKDLKPVVQAFNELYTVSISIEPEKAWVVMQEDEDGIIAPEGQHEAGVQIVREWKELR